MIYLDCSVPLAYLLAEDRYPSNAVGPADRFKPAARMRGLELDQCASASRLPRRCRPRPCRPDRVHRNGAAALEPFPAPVRTLDALHLAAIEFIRTQGARVELASYDERLLDAARIPEWNGNQ